MENINQSLFYPDYSGSFGDTRLDRRGQELWKGLSIHPCSSVRKISETPAEQKAYYRFLNNEKVEEQELVKECSRRMTKLAKGRHLLCVQDTCEVNLSGHKGRLKPNSGLGLSDKSKTFHCFKIHPGLVLDANSLNPLGFSHIKIFHRPEDMPNRNERKYKTQPIEEKESYKWIEVAKRSKEILQEAETVTHIEDREGDIFEQFAIIPDEKHHLLIRSRTTRNLSNGKKLYEEVDSAPVAGTYTIEIPTDKRKKQYMRTANIELRFISCSIKCPQNLIKKDYPSSIPVNCISVKEIGDVANPVNWKLLTTHSVEDFEQALLLVSWYSARWYIEQVFRLLKHQGFGIEDTELESGWAIRKLVIMQMTALLKILQMNIAYSQPEGGQEIEEVFDEEQIKVLHLMNEKLQGKTVKLQNNNDPKKTKWAAWVIGRIGGWKGYDSQGPPGVIILKRGFDRLSYIIEGMNLIKDVGTR
ncbi:MAG: IS4 family transposase, partial [Bacteroidales bacterium]|nr:IS4 family transposase [Bacteroidales bacterium]